MRKLIENNGTLYIQYRNGTKTDNSTAFDTISNTKFEGWIRKGCQETLPLTMKPFRKNGFTQIFVGAGNLE